MKPAITSNATSGETRCLGWCNKTFWSVDKTKIRFCIKCRNRRNQVSQSLSRVELQQLDRVDSINVIEENT